MKMMIRATALATLLIAGGVAVLAADAPAIVRNELLHTDIAGGLEAILGRTTMAVGSDTGRHIHPGTELATLAVGTVELTIDGQPPRTIKAGEAFTIPYKAVHHLRVIGDVPVVIMPTWIIEKGQPLTIPVK